MKKAPLIVVLSISLLQLATTYVIKEGGREVGRYDEADGKTDVVEMAGAAPKPVPMKKETKLVYSDVGYSASLVETGKMVPDRRRKMLVSGRVVNILTAAAVPGGKLIFISDLEKVEVPVAWSGSFSASIPKPEKTALSFTYVPPSGFSPIVSIHSSGELAKIPAKERRKGAQGISFSAISPVSWASVELWAVPEKLPPLEPDEELVQNEE